MNTYEQYLEHPAGNTITIEEAKEIYSKMVSSISACTTEDKLDFWNDFIHKTTEYAYIRSRWETMSKKEKMDADDGRTMKHNSIITAINVLSRIAEQDGADNSWRTELGDNRKRIGDFACFVSFITGISNR